MKKIFTMLLAFLLVLSSCGTSAATPERADRATEYTYNRNPPEFVNKVISVIQDTWQDEYFSCATITLGEKSMVVDGREVELDRAAAVVGGELVLPVAEIAEALGSEADKQSPGKSAAMASQEETEAALNVSVHRDGDKIIITKPYQMKQLMVRMNNGAKLEDTYGAMQVLDSGTDFYFLLYASEESTEEAMRLLNEDANVKYTEPNIVVSGANAANAIATSTTGTTSTSLLYTRWGSERVGADTFKDYLGENDKTEEIWVAVVDSGIDTIHSIFDGRLARDAQNEIVGFDYTGGNGRDPSNDVYDDLGHGTHVAGTIVDCTPENVKILSLKVLDEQDRGDTFRIGAAIGLSADLGAKVVNLSLGGYCYYIVDNGDDDLGMMQWWKENVDYAEALGSVCVVSAGNYNVNIEQMEQKNRGYYPANFDNVITVAATDSDNTPTQFSNYGNNVDIAAPGEEVLSSFSLGALDEMRYWDPYDEDLGPELPGGIESLPDGYEVFHAVGNIYSSTRAIVCDPSGDIYTYMTGTSMAAPHVAAAAAMLKLDNPDASPELLKKMVCETVDVPAGWNTSMNSGQYYGTGILNLDNYTKPEVTTTVPGLTFNGTAFIFNTVDLTAIGILQGGSVYVKINRYSASDTLLGTASGAAAINASGTGSYTPASAEVKTFNADDTLEILVFESSAYANRTDGLGLITRQVIQPTLFAF